MSIVTTRTMVKRSYYTRRSKTEIIRRIREMQYNLQEINDHTIEDFPHYIQVKLLMANHVLEKNHTADKLASVALAMHRLFAD